MYDFDVNHTSSTDRHACHEGDRTMPIAVVGMSCRLPGGATSPEKLWQICAEQQDMWQPFPSERMNHSALYHPDPNHNGTVSRP